MHTHTHTYDHIPYILVYRSNVDDLIFRTKLISTYIHE